MSDNFFDDQALLENFVSESKENLDIAESSLLEMEEEDRAELVNDVFRAVHSIKGAASFFKKNNIASITHTEENILSIIRAGQAEITPEIVSALLETNDVLKQLFDAEDLGEGEDIQEILAKLRKIEATLENPAAFSHKEAGEISENASGLDPDLFQEALKQKRKDHLYRILLNHQLLETIDADAYLFDKIDGIGDIICQSHPVSALSEEVPEIEIYFESIIEPDIFIPTVQAPELPVIHMNEDEIKDAGSSSGRESKGTPDDVEKIPPPEKLHDAEAKKTAAETKKAAVMPPPRPVAQSVRIGVNVLDELLELIGEVVLGRNQFLTKYYNDSNFKSLSQSITKLHQHVIQTRMQAISTLFDKYKRTVRDLSKQLSKKIDLKIDGGDLELDRTILEGLADPMTHLVRNSIDHGIESPEERSKQGKGVVGNISLRAIHESGQILIEIEDDGRGLDRERIIEKAVEKELITQEDVVEMDDKEIFSFIFHPGFSTKDTPTEISGRGVGMDVVKTNLEKLGCNIEITSKKQKGTLISISIPLTQAVVNSSVISGLIISIGEYSLAIPQLAVNEIIKLLPDEQIEKIEMIKGQEVFKLRDRIIPLVHLEDVLGIGRTCYDPRHDKFLKDRRKQLHDPDVNIHKERRKKSIIFIVLNFKHEYFGILVDKIEGTEEIVVKRMPKIIKNRKVFAGATILGNGKVSLILDINGIVEKAHLNFNKKRDAHFDILHMKHKGEDIQKIVIFNNAEEEYFAIPVNLLSEVDRFYPEEIRIVGKREFIKRHGESIPLIRLENLLKVNRISDRKDSHIIFIPSRLKYPTGIVGSSIIASIDLTDDINTKEADERGVMGTFFYDTILVNLLDLYTLIQKSDPEKHTFDFDERLQDCRVLFADDQLFFRQLVMQYFRSYNVRNVTLAKNGQEALQILYENPDKFDVVVSDIEMPILDGYQLVSSIKADDKLSRIPVMALTTLDGEQNVRKGYEAGFDAYEIKLDKENVIKRLAKLYLSR